MTKEGLIALSDLNREDNIKYISSEAQGIAIALDSDRYAPALCKLERAYICGRRKSENYIADLEKENADLKMGLKWDADNRDELLKENAGLKSRLNAINLLTPELEKASKLRKRQLATAKEIIKELLDTQSQLDPYRDIFKDRILKAEQFLEEVKE